MIKFVFRNRRTMYAFAIFSTKPHMNFEVTYPKAGFSSAAASGNIYVYRARERFEHYGDIPLFSATTITGKGILLNKKAINRRISLKEEYIPVVLDLRMKIFLMLAKINLWKVVNG